MFFNTFIVTQQLLQEYGSEIQLDINGILISYTFDLLQCVLTKLHCVIAKTQCTKRSCKLILTWYDKLKLWFCFNRMQWSCAWCFGHRILLQHPLQLGQEQDEVGVVHETVVARFTIDDVHVVGHEPLHQQQARLVGHVLILKMKVRNCHLPEWWSP